MQIVRATPSMSQSKDLIIATAIAAATTISPYVSEKYANFKAIFSGVSDAIGGKAVKDIISERDIVQERAKYADASQLDICEYQIRQTEDNISNLIMKLYCITIVAIILSLYFSIENKIHKKFIFIFTTIILTATTLIKLIKLSFYEISKLTILIIFDIIIELGVYSFTKILICFTIYSGWSILQNALMKFLKLIALALGISDRRVRKVRRERKERPQSRGRARSRSRSRRR